MTTDLQLLSGLPDGLEVLYHCLHMLLSPALQLLMFGALICAKQQVTRDRRHIRRQQVVCEDEAATICSKRQ